jgi:hypothetical protein
MIEKFDSRGALNHMSICENPLRTRIIGDEATAPRQWITACIVGLNEDHALQGLVQGCRACSHAPGCVDAKDNKQNGPSEEKMASSELESVA